MRKWKQITDLVSNLLKKPGKQLIVIPNCPACDSVHVQYFRYKKDEDKLFWVHIGYSCGSMYDTDHNGQLNMFKPCKEKG